MQAGDTGQQVVYRVGGWGQEVGGMGRVLVLEEYIYMVKELALGQRRVLVLEVVGVLLVYVYNQIHNSGLCSNHLLSYISCTCPHLVCTGKAVPQPVVAALRERRQLWSFRGVCHHFVAHS